MDGSFLLSRSAARFTANVIGARRIEALSSAPGGGPLVKDSTRFFVSGRGPEEVGKREFVAVRVPIFLERANVVRSSRTTRPAAVRALETCPDDRDHITKHMLALSTYLGHASVANTYWYLEATPELLEKIADRCESFVMGEKS